MNMQTVDIAGAQKLVDQQARELIFQQPFWGSLLLHLTRVYTFQVQTMATDGARLFINPSFVHLLTKGGLRTVLAHEVSHCALRHFLRLRGRDLERWNRATDYRINYDLVAAKFEAPIWLGEDGAKHTWLYDAKYAKQTSEQIYDQEMIADAKKAQQPKPQQQGGQAGQQGGSGAQQNGQQGGSAGQQGGSGSQAGQSKPGGSGATGKPASGQGRQAGQAGGSQAGQAGQKGGSQAGAPAKAAGGSAGGQGGQAGDNGAGSGSAPAGGLPSAIGEDMGIGGILPAPEGMTESDLEANWTIRVRQAVAVADKYKGNVPGFVREMLDKLNNPKVDWRSRIRDFSADALNNEADWTSPDRRLLWQGLILPGYPQNALSKILFLADTSLSMATRELSAAFSEAQSMLDEGLVQSMQWACVDTRVASHGELFAGDTFEGFKVSGRGGTNFANAMQWANEQEPRLILFFTDGETMNWGKEPDCPVLIMGLKSQEKALRKCPYGEVLTIELD